VVRPAQTAIPAYLTGLAGAATDRGAQLHPLRPLFGPSVGEFGDAADQQNPTSVGTQPDSVANTPLATTRASLPPQQLRPTIRRAPAVNPGFADAPAAQPVSQTQLPVPPPATPAPTPDPKFDATTAPAPAPLSPTRTIPLAAPPLAPIERIVTPRASDVSLHAPPPARPVAAPTGPPPLPPAPPQPDMRPSTPTDDNHESPPPTTRFAHPEAAVPELVPLKREPDQPRPSTAAVPSAPQVSIGTIEVFVAPPPPTHDPVPTVHQPLRATQPTLPGRASTEVARRQARRWYGAGQS
jgi:hypothetical protein